MAYQFLQKAGGMFSEADWPYYKEGMFPCMPKGWVLCPSHWPRGYNKAYCGNHDDLYCRANSTKGAVAEGVSLEKKRRSGALGSLPCHKGLCNSRDGLEILEPCLNLID